MYKCYYVYVYIETSQQQDSVLEGYLNAEVAICSDLVATATYDASRWRWALVVLVRPGELVSGLA